MPNTAASTQAGGTRSALPVRLESMSATRTEGGGVEAGRAQSS